MQEMEKHSVTDVVRACEPTYEKQSLEKREISVHVRDFLYAEALQSWRDPYAFFFLILLIYRTGPLMMAKLRQNRLSRIG